MKLAITLIVAGSGFLAGCMALPIAATALGGASLALGGASLYNATNPDKSVAVTITPEEAQKLRNQLKGANHMAILASTSAATSFSDAWEKAGKRASIVTDQGDPAALSMSQARAVMVNACKGGVDTVAYGRLGSVDVNRMTMLIGKADAKLKSDIFIHSCRTRQVDSVGVEFAFNAAGQSAQEIDRLIGAGLAAKFLEVSR